jgi:hypothetical protein
MALCDACKRLKIHLLPDPADNSDQGIYSGFPHSTTGVLLVSAQSCPCCALIKESFLRVGHYHIPKAVVEDELRLEPSTPVFLRAGRREEDESSDGGGGEGARLDSIEVLVGYGKKFMRGRIYLYARKGKIPIHITRVLLIRRGSPAVLSGDVVEKPMLVDGTRRPNELVQEWLNACLSHHALCRTDFSGNPVIEVEPTGIYPVQPRRLIKVFEENDGVTSPRLVERWPPRHVDYYAALSHCWGPPDKRPLCTTKATLAQHLLQIPWHHLPQTFQDSILLCIDLSIQYLWIDSLCIIQDDEEDWKRESKIMGSIYECARFTIAASSAINSTEGLFKVRKPLNLVEIPYNKTTGKGERTDLVLAYIEPDLDKCLSSSPLNQRAWVMQEYYLSRRTVHFTTHGLVWSCKNGKRPQTRHIRSEFGTSWETVFEDDWKTLVQSYTRRELTYKSDKLVALEGLASKFRYHNSGKKISYRHGLWLGDQPHDLLWYGERRLSREVGNGIPSWSWASATGPISFKESVFENPKIFHAKIILRWCSDFSLKNRPPGFSLDMKVLARRIDNLDGPVQCQAFCFEDLQDMGFTGRMHEDYKNGNLHVAPTFVFLSGGKKVGWGVFDEHEKPHGDVICLPFIKQKVWEGFAMSKEQYFLWVLLVTPTVEADEYERVGWGLHFVPSWFDELVVRDICLV